MRNSIDIVESIIPLKILSIDLTVFSKPSTAQIIAMMGRHERIRELECNGTVYLWDGYLAAHFQVAANLGLEKPTEFQITNFADGPVVTIYGKRDSLMSVPAFKRFIDKVKPLIGGY